MSDLALPPSAPNSGPMTREDVAAVRREKEMDSRVRAQLEARYGSARPFRRGHRMTRQTPWKCAACGRMSHDARRVCAFCLTPEPNAVGDPTLPPRSHPTHSDPTRRKEWITATMRPGVTREAMVQLLHLPHNRCYRTHPAAEATATTALPSAQTEETNDVLSPPRPRHLRAASYTHFVSLPIGQWPSVRSAAASLLEAMRAQRMDPSSDVSPDVFSVAPRLHVTLLMLALPTAEARELAAECMRVFADKWRARGGGRHEVRFGGLHVMKGRARSERRADVVYMGIPDTSSQAALLSLQRLVRECFAELRVNDPRATPEDPLLHVTLMNSKWRRSITEEEGKMEANANVSDSLPKSTTRVPFDARQILREFGNATLRGDGEDGAVKLECVELCQLGYDAEKECYPCEYRVEL